MPRTPEQYRGMTRRNQLRRWLNHGGNLRFGNLNLVDVFDNRKLLVAETYGRRFALIESIDHVAHVLYDLPYRSVTSAGHRNRVLEALEREGYHITEFSNQAGLDEVYDSIVGLVEPTDHLNAVEEISEDQIPVPTPIATPTLSEMGAQRPSQPGVATAARRNRTHNDWWFEPGGENLRYATNANWTISVNRTSHDPNEEPALESAEEQLRDLVEPLCEPHWTARLRNALVTAHRNETEHDSRAALRDALQMLLNSANLTGFHVGLDSEGRPVYTMNEGEENDE